MKRTAMVFTALLCLLLFASCGKGVTVTYEQPPLNAPNAGNSWTVLVYMIGGGEESKNGSYSQKLADIMSVNYPGNIHVAVQTGGSVKWHIKGIYSDYTQRFEVGQGKLYLADQKQAASMGDYRSLTDFITWGTSRYKTDNYMLILSGTGGGSMYGMGSDEVYENDSLSLEEISYAMSVAGTKFEVVGMDAPLMGSLETAAALSNYTDYLVAPQDIQSVNSWDYSGFLGYICKYNNASAEDVGKVICDGYYSGEVRNGSEKYAAMSVTDTSNITTLNQAFDGMAGDMLIATDSLDNYKNLSAALNKVHIYGGGSADEGCSDLVDIGDMAVKCAEYVGMTADRMIEVLNETVVYRVCGSEQTGASGLSVYYPLDLDSERLQQYMDMSHGSRYKEFLRKICVGCDVYDTVTNTADYTNSWAWATYQNDMAWLEYKSILDGNTYELDILGNMDLFRDVAMNVYKRDKKSGQYVFVGRYHDLETDWGSGIFKAGFNGSLPRLMGKPITMSLVRSYDDYDLYTIPVLVNGKTAAIRVKYQNGSYDIIGYWNALDANGQTLGALRKLKASDRVTPLLAVYNEHGEKSYTAGKSAKKLWRGVSEEKTGDGNYIFEFVMTDIYGLERYGTPVNARVSGYRVTYN